MPQSAEKGIVYRVARTKGEVEEAFSLVYKEYAQRRYIPKNYKSRLRLSLYNALPTTTILLALKGKRVIATVTLIPDSPLGLQMDKIYKKELDVLRKRGRRLSECSQLAIDTNLFPKGWFSMFNFNKFIFIFRLFKILLDHALCIGKLHDFCIAINPKQQYVYNFIGFEKLGGLKYYGSVNKAPAIAKRLNLVSYEKDVRSRWSLHKIFFGHKTNPDLFKDKFQMRGSDLEYFFLKKSDIFLKATKKQLAYIQSCYKDVNLNTLIKKYK